MMSCYKWELEAILEGLALKNVDERENLAELAANVRYTIHSKSVSTNKLFNKEKEEQRVLGAVNQSNDKKNDSVLANKIRIMNEHFRNKNNKESE